MLPQRDELGGLCESSLSVSFSHSLFFSHILSFFLSRRSISSMRRGCRHPKTSLDIRQLKSMPGRVRANARISSRNGEIPEANLHEENGGAKCIAVHSRRMIGRSISGGWTFGMSFLHLCTALLTRRLIIRSTKISNPVQSSHAAEIGTRTMLIIVSAAIVSVSAKIYVSEKREWNKKKFYLMLKYSKDTFVIYMPSTYRYRIWG